MPVLLVVPVLDLSKVLLILSIRVATFRFSRRLLVLRRRRGRTLLLVLSRLTLRLRILLTTTRLSIYFIAEATLIKSR